MARHWRIVAADAASYDDGIGAGAAIGMIALSVDRATVADCALWLAPFPEAAVFSTRVPMAAEATPDTLAAMGDHLAEAAARLPEGRLHALAFSCTSALVAIGAERVHAALGAARPDVPVVTPLEAAVAGFRALGVRRLSLLAPYHRPAADLVAGHFEAEGFVLDRCTTFDLDGDLEMNRLALPAIVAAARGAFDPASEGLFISCTGLRTSGAVAPLEDALGVPVITSNGATCWGSLCHAGVSDLSRGEGRLFGARLP